jgi:hypothetical protein
LEATSLFRLLHAAARSAIEAARATKSATGSSRFVLISTTGKTGLFRAALALSVLIASFAMGRHNVLRAVLI